MSGEQVVASFVIKNDDATNPTGAVRLRIDCAGGYLNYGGTLGNMASATKLKQPGQQARYESVFRVDSVLSS